MLAHYQGHSQLKKGLQIVSSTQISNHNTLSQYNESSTFLTDGSLHFIQVIDEILSVELNNDSKDTNFKEQLDNSISTQQLTLVNHDEYYYTELQEKEGLNKNDTIKKLIIFKFESLKIGNLINYENSKTSNYWQYNGIFNNCLLLCFDDYQYDDSIMRTIIARLDEENDMLLSEKRRSKNKKISIYSGLEQRFVNYLLSDNQLTGNQQRSQFKQLFFPSEMESIGLQSSQILRSQTHTSQY